MLREERRKLAAILAADVAGYSRLMAEDESDTLARLRRLRAEVLEPKIAQFHGRIVGSAGDSLLVEFASAVEAVRCAVDVQESDWECTLEEGAVRVGLKWVKGLGEEGGKRIARERPYRSLEDFRLKTALPADARRRLAEAGALSSLGERRDALWEMAQTAVPTALPLDFAEAPGRQIAANRMRASTSTFRRSR